VDAEDVAEEMFVSTQSVYRYAATGDVKLLNFAKKNGPSRVLCHHEEYIVVQLVLSKPGIYLREIQEKLYVCTMNWGDSIYIHLLTFINSHKHPCVIDTQSYEYFCNCTQTDFNQISNIKAVALEGSNLVYSFPRKCSMILPKG
jgi:hypothetical protein